MSPTGLCVLHRISVNDIRILRCVSELQNKIRTIEIQEEFFELYFRQRLILG